MKNDKVNLEEIIKTIEKNLNKILSKRQIKNLKLIGTTMFSWILDKGFQIIYLSYKKKYRLFLVIFQLTIIGAILLIFITFSKIK